MHIYFCTTPKAGSQWFRDLMNNPLLQAHVPWRHRRHQPRELNLYADRWPGSEQEDLFYGPLYGTTPAFAARHVRPEDRVIGLFRDPRDVAVSWMYSVLFSHEPSQDNDLIGPVLGSLPAAQRLRLSLIFAYQVSAGQGFWFLDLPSNFKVITYERLVADTPAVMTEVLRFVGSEVPVDVVQAVCRKFSFEALSHGRERGDENVYSHHRKGIVGDWRNYFSRELGRTVEAFKPGLLQRLGYESDERWWEQLPESAGQQLPEPDQSAEIARLRSRVGVLEEHLQGAEAAARERLQLIEDLQRTAEERLALIRSLERTAEERLQLIERLSGRGWFRRIR